VENIISRRSKYVVANKWRTLLCQEWYYKKIFVKQKLKNAERVFYAGVETIL
jgi:hypothetical protein